LSDELTVTGPTLRLVDVVAGYAGRPVVHGVSVEATPGRIVSIVGPNGSGKSTLLKSVVGVVQILSGSVLVNDVDVTNRRSEDIARIGVGYVPQVDDVFAPLTVRENLEMGGYLLPRSQVAQRVREVVSLFPRLGTMLSRRASKLSGGERKMLAMGRVLMLEPAVVILDEPTANLAPAIAAQLLEQHVRMLADSGAAILIVEQRAKAILGISDFTYVLAGGRLTMSGTPEQLASDPAFVASFLGGVPHSERTDGPLLPADQ
jgi:ABC-type branched-subunit amino acid transport system ATPase component